MAHLYDSAGDDTFIARPERAAMQGNGFMNVARGFEHVEAQAIVGGHDVAFLYDSTGDDSMVARAWGAYLYGQEYYNETRGFKQITARLVNGGDNITDVQAVDYLFTLVGQWS
jgi:hypothetical protein